MTQLTPVGALDEGAVLEPGHNFEIVLPSPEAAATFRYRMYNARRAVRRQSYRLYDVLDDGYDVTPWDDVSIYKGALPGVLVVKRVAPVLASVKEK